MPSPIFIKIESNVQAFVTELTALVRAAALDAVQGALGGSAPARRGRGRPKGSGRKPAATGKAKRGARRVRRTSEAVEATQAKFLAFVKSNDGKRLEEISRALGIDSADLKLPAQKLLVAKAVRTTGAKRGTKYHVAGGGAAKAAKRAKKA